MACRTRRRYCADARLPRAIMVVQCSDRTTGFAARHRSFAAEAGYTYRFAALKRSECPYTEKVKAIVRNYRRPSMRAGDLLLYIDTDVKYTEDGAFEAQLSTTWACSSDGTPCWFSALDAPVTINTGVVLIRKASRQALCSSRLMWRHARRLYVDWQQTRSACKHLRCAG